MKDKLFLVIVSLSVVVTLLSSIFIVILAMPTEEDKIKIFKIECRDTGAIELNTCYKKKVDSMETRTTKYHKCFFGINGCKSYEEVIFKTIHKKDINQKFLLANCQCRYPCKEYVCFNDYVVEMNNEK